MVIEGTGLNVDGVGIVEGDLIMIREMTEATTDTTGTTAVKDT